MTLKLRRLMTLKCRINDINYSEMYTFKCLSTGEVVGSVAVGLL